MSDKNKMPPQLLAHFKSKQGGEEAKDSKTGPDTDDKSKRKQAVTKARIRIEEKSRKSPHGKEKEAG